MYRALAERYGWTPDEIANMTPQQQADFLDGGKETIAFSSMAEYRRWRSMGVTG